MPILILGYPLLDVGLEVLVVGWDSMAAREVVAPEGAEVDTAGVRLHLLIHGGRDRFQGPGLDLLSHLQEVGGIARDRPLTHAAGQGLHRHLEGGGLDGMVMTTTDDAAPAVRATIVVADVEEEEEAGRGTEEATVENVMGTGICLFRIDYSSASEVV